jgi:hypothetical protein
MIKDKYISKAVSILKRIETLSKEEATQILAEELLYAFNHGATMEQIIREWRMSC